MPDTSILAAGLGSSNIDLNNIFQNWGGGLGSLFSSGVYSAGNSMYNNLIKGQYLTEGLQNDVASSIMGSAAGLAANGIGKGLNSLGGNTHLSRGISQGIATGLGTVGGQVGQNLINGKNLFNGFSGFGSVKSSISNAYNSALATTEGNRIAAAAAAADAGKATKLANMNLAGLGMSMVGT